MPSCWHAWCRSQRQRRGGLCRRHRPHDVERVGLLGAGTSLKTDFISGLGALAKQDTARADQVTGLGSMARQNSAQIGSTVTLPDGTVLGTGDFVNKLSKIGSSNISTFMESAAIGNAYIGNAAVSTLNIAGNAVTVPMLTEGLYGASFAPTPDWAQYMTSGYSTWPGGTFLTVIAAVTCTQTSGGDCEMMCVLMNSAGGEMQIFRSVQTMRSYDKLTVVFMGGVVIPHDDSWRVRIYMRNSWHNGTWVSDKTNILAIGAKR